MSIDIRLSKRKFLSFGKSYKKKLFIGNRKKNNNNKIAKSYSMHPSVKLFIIWNRISIKYCNLGFNKFWTFSLGIASKKSRIMQYFITETFL
jgi:hypothetical protein